MSALRNLLVFLCFCCCSNLLGQTPVEYFFANQTVCTNDTVRLPLQVRDFINVQNFQSSVRWNPAALTFQSLDEIHPALANNFLTNTDSVSSGGVGYFWLDNSSGEPPLVLTDSSVLFVLKFIPIGIETTTEVGFGEVPTLTETVVENNDIPMQVASAQVPGFITKNEITAEAEIQSATNGNNGQINLTITAGQTPFDNEFHNTLSITPNPTHDFLNIHFIENDLNGNYQYKFYDVRGNLLFQKNNLNSELIENIDLQNQASGLYFLEIKTKMNNQIFKIVKN